MNLDKEVDDIVAPIPEKKVNVLLIASVALGTILFVASVAWFSGIISINLPSPPTTSAGPTTDARIKGNKNSRIYHLPGCPNYDDISPKNIIWFKTEDEAKAAGFRKAKNC